MIGMSEHGFVQPHDYVSVEGRSARVVYVAHPLVRVTYLDTGEKDIVSLSRIMPELFGTCRGCGAETSHEYELCRNCQHEQEAESAADQRDE